MELFKTKISYQIKKGEKINLFPFLIYKIINYNNELILSAKACLDEAPTI